ncbi:MAG: hypothetical protein CVV04_03190 [Firmicutes bacterium HGW-Firmicutes-9]|jgi:hypothetical protein|nr:MAG: hypothetical protein CVV04_03190 [Firmicutes bacterium HGW-Firmicutes-9]
MSGKNQILMPLLWASLPIVIGLAAAFSVLALVKKDISITNFEFLLNSAITCAATFTGFVLTSISILLGLGSCSVMCALREGSGFTELKILYSTTLVLGFVVILFATTSGACLPFEKCIPKALLSIGAGTIFSYLSSLLITGFVLLKLINLAPKESAVSIDMKPSTPEE